MTGNCVSLTLQSTFNYFNLSCQDSYSINTLREFIKVCINNNLNCILFYPLPLLIPFTVLTNLKIYYSKSDFSKSIEKKSGVLVHHATAKQLYNISDSWTHFVCEYYHNGCQIYYYDSYKDELVNDYGDSFSSEVNLKELFNKIHVMVFVYE